MENTSGEKVLLEGWLREFVNWTFALHFIQSNGFMDINIQ